MRLSTLRLGFVSFLPGCGKRSYVPWNAGKAVGQKRAFSISEARSLKTLLRKKGELRNLALVSVAFDSCLRSCDLLSLRWEQLLDRLGRVRTRVTIRQQKTGSNVTFVLSENTALCLETLARRRTSLFVFSGGASRGRLSSRQYRRLVRHWAGLLGLDAPAYGTHSLRRTRPAALYRKTGNAELARILLGQKTLLATHRYLGLDQEDALAQAEMIQI